MLCPRQISKKSGTSLTQHLWLLPALTMLPLTLIVSNPGAGLPFPNSVSLSQLPHLSYHGWVPSAGRVQSGSFLLAPTYSKTLSSAVCLRSRDAPFSFTLVICPVGLPPPQTPFPRLCAVPCNFHAFSGARRVS